MGSSNAPYIMTLVNSIIGVSILAMPFCYKQCGILLASLILIFSNFMTRLSCHYLLKSAIMTRRRTFELLAFHAFGNSGKTVVELSIILLMIGTCIAFFVVMGDLGPAIIGSLLEIEYFDALRPAVLIGLAVFVVLPLGLLRNVDSLGSICTASFLFYLFLVFKVFIESMNNLFSRSWIEEVEYWKPAGILQCLPIFSMALSCQTQLLEIFDSVTNGTLDRMNSIVKSAVNLCTALYIGVGFFGYIAYYKQTFSGNLLMSFSESYFSEFIKLGFVLSVAVTFPMVIFPCRTSLHSLLLKKVHVPHYELVTGGGNHISETQFKCITLFIITSSLIVGLLAPNIEIVLGLLGSTIGVIICVLCPPCLFISITNKATTEKVLAQMMCALGLFIMIMGTYANLYLSESASSVEPQAWKNIDPQSVKLSVDPQLKTLVVENNVNLNDKNDLQNSVKKPEVMEKPIQVKSKISNVVVKDSLKPKETKVEENKMESPISVDTINKKVPTRDGRNMPNERIEPPVPVAPEIINVPVKVVDPQPERKHLSEPEKSDKIDEKKNPLVGENSQLQLNDQEKSLNEQKQVLKKIREKKQADKTDSKSLRKSNENNENKIVGEQINENAEGAQPTAFAKSQQNGVKDVVKEISDKPPLLILMNNGLNDKKINKSSAGDLQPDILGNEPIVEREKRDLYFVTNATSDNMEFDAKPVFANEGEVLAVGPKETDDSFVKHVAKTKSENPSCEKMENENLRNVDDKVKDISVVSQKSVIVNSTKEELQNRENDRSTILSSSKLPIYRKLEKVTSQEKKLYEAEGKEVIPLVSGSSAGSSPREEKSSVISMEEKREHNDKMKKNENNIILAPSKLSEPSAVLEEKLQIDDPGKPVTLDLLKPMQRELKTISNKEDSGNRKNKVSA